MKLFLTVLFLSFLFAITRPTLANGCFQVERDALLTFKAGLQDPGNLLSSWHGPDCCNWTGVICHAIHHHVVELNLTNPYDFDDYACSDWESHALSGEINPALLSLKYLTHLDLSNHDFSNSSIPKFIGSFEYLVYLNLSLSGFQGVIPREIGNLSRLQFLDLSYSNFTSLIPPQLGNLSDLRYLSLRYSYWYTSKPVSNSLSWLSRLSNLRYLDLSDNDLNNKVDWSAINEMQQLETLILFGCFLSEIPMDLSHVNLTSLTKLDLSYNSFNATLPNWLWNLTGLLHIDLFACEFHGSVPSTLSNLASLNFLALGWNNFEHGFLEPISKLLKLRSLNLNGLGIGGDIVNLVKRLGSMWYNLEDVYLESNELSGNISSWIAQMRNLSFLYLGFNSLSGHLPSEIGTLSYLRKLDLFNNSLSGHIPSEIGALSHLKELDMSYNSFSGVITEAHFVNLSNLEGLDLSHNMLTLEINDKWVPPFQLQYLYLDSCKVGSRFLSWLRWQTRLSYMALPNTSITEVIPIWFWNMPLKWVDLSSNNITGSLPKSFQSSKLRVLNLKYNNISGPIPSIWGWIELLDLSNNNISGSFPTKLEFSRAIFVTLSENRINGTIPQDICNMSNLNVLDLSDNTISGEIPDCWKNISNLQYIDLSNNQITGELPTSFGSLKYLTTLNLYNNKLYGKIPSNLQHCKDLVFLSLGGNNFSGEIPAWIGKQLQNLVVFQLRSNKFTGYIPTELGELKELQILDLAHNSLVGTIPSSVGNFSSMKNSSQYYSTGLGFETSTYEDTLYIDINGQNVYTSMPLEWVKTIDISGNNLNGQIPEEIWLLQAMINLNLSKNFLIGQIPQIISDMKSLESLDLSFNKFSGLIPQALSTLSSLHNLNLSYNNFSGKIPSGRQLDTLNDSSIYVGNSYLCGPPTDKNCSEDQQASNGVNMVHGNHRMEMVWFNLAIDLGFILGFWSICGVLIFHNVWRVAYFRRIDNLFDKIYVQIVLATRRLIHNNS